MESWTEFNSVFLFRVSSNWKTFCEMPLDVVSLLKNLQTLLREKNLVYAHIYIKMLFKKRNRKEFVFSNTSVISNSVGKKLWAKN